MLNNFTLNKYFVKIKLSCSKGRWSSKSSEIEQNDVTNDVIGSKKRHGIKKVFSQNVLLVMLNNFTLNKYFVKIKLSCSKGRWSGKISEIEQNDVTNDVIGQKRDMVLKKYFARLFLWSLWTFLLLVYISKKSSWVVQKGDEVVKLVKLSKMTS